ncbi:Lrp/AsnC family transcriptional regulator [Saccharopolyspora hirsuta]|uniref:Lrp/AsnC family transcriptional regulator n=1 Tax=Saccharopolyspora hirsuta TaxID=1837 RepID=A0A5M7BAG5_SACHI|nr:Lrp/AsnC family transcriptional regulator [Saccharopolyspora hirsuta]KAA5826573.1 Lrp/AsnC family transcriptional regulator [Saccharopolyspora hirsuta]
MPAKQRPLDEIDAQLLDLLQADADRTLRELGDEVGLSPSAVQRRITGYKTTGLLRTVAVVNTDRTPSLTQALVLLTLVEESPEHHRRIADRLRAQPEVQQCYALSGRWDYAVLLTATSIRALRDLSDALFKTDDNIRRYDTMFLLDTVKSGTTLPSEFLLP